MSHNALATLEGLIGGPRDNALLRHALGLEYLRASRLADAEAAFRTATLHDPEATASWKMLGKALLQQGNRAEAEKTWQQGLQVAERRGDRQAAREMQVFLKRLQAPPDDAPAL